MTYRPIDASEWAALEPEFASRGVGLPDPDHAFIMGAFKDSGELAGFIACQAQIHAEPLRLYDPFAFRGLMRALDEEVRKRCGGIPYYAFTDDDKVGGMIGAVGFKRLSFGVYEKAVA